MEAQHDWKPLESNPEVINEYLKKLGLDTYLYQIHDVMALQDWAFDMLPKPIRAFILLFPCSEAHLKASQEQSKTLSMEHVPKGTFFMKQRAMNACGTIALIHSLFNCNDIKFAEGSFLALKKVEWHSEKVTASEIGKLFQSSKELITQHKKAVEEGKTEVQDAVASHFIAFVPVEGQLLQFDGNKDQPVPHGPTSLETFPADCTPVLKAFMERDPANVNFSIMALAPSQ